MRTLIVDDSAVMRKFVERSLRQAGLDITELHQASNGTEALEVLKTVRSFDLILSDITMPVMDGLEFLKQRRIQDLAPQVPVIMITTEASADQVFLAKSAGASGYLCKPFTSDQVKACIDPLLSTRTQS